MPNSSFESYIHCPDFWNDVDSCVGWKQYHEGTPDYFNKCDATNWVGVPSNAIGHQVAGGGDAYMGLIAYSAVEQNNYREYITAKLISPMMKGGTYETSMLVSLADSSRWWVDGLGIHFYENGPVVPIAGTKTVLGITPIAMFQAVDNYKNWIRLTRQFIADSPYRHIIIGNWLADSKQVRGASIGSYQYSYYYIDSVVTRMIGSVFINFNDSILCTPGIFTVPFTAISAGDSFASDNIFTVQLSDANGSFSNPVNIGSLQSASSGLIICSLPVGIIPGSTYRLRIIASNPMRYSLDNGKDITIGISPQGVYALSNSPVCSGDLLKLRANSSAADVRFSWVGPAGFSNDSATVFFPARLEDSGIYVVSVSAGMEQCAVKDSVNVTIKPAPENVYATSRGSLCKGDTLLLMSGNTSSGVFYTWQRGNNFLSSDSVVYLLHNAIPGLYRLTASIGDCKKEMMVRIEECLCSPTVPSAFTPNEDALNDEISPKLNCDIINYEFTIRNRFGEAVFRSTAYGEGWNGTYKGARCDLGTYYYFLAIRTYAGANFYFKGDIILVR